MNSHLTAEYIKTILCQEIDKARTITQYREPLVGFASVDHPEFHKLQKTVHPAHKLPKDLLPSARSVISFFLPFEERIVSANSIEKETIATEWVESYLETNALIEKITDLLITGLFERGIQAVTMPPTGNFNRETLFSPWSHKSMAVIAGLGSFGLHHLVITESGCAGRFGSLVVNVDLPYEDHEPKERCLYFMDESCLECVLLCPAGALDPNDGLDKQLCWDQCQKNAKSHLDLGQATVCGKCAVGVCALESST